MPEQTGELLDPATTLADLAVAAFDEAKRELAEYERTLTNALGAKPGPKTVGEREIEAATAESVGILGVKTEWKRGRLKTSPGHYWRCLFARIDGRDDALLIYLTGKLGLCVLIPCREHCHLRRLSSLADLGEMLSWTIVDCWRESMTSGDDNHKTITFLL